MAAQSHRRKKEPDDPSMIKGNESEAKRLCVCVLSVQLIVRAAEYGGGGWMDCEKCARLRLNKTNEKTSDSTITSDMR